MFFTFTKFGQKQPEKLQKMLRRQRRQIWHNTVCQAPKIGRYYPFDLGNKKTLERRLKEKTSKWFKTISRKVRPPISPLLEGSSIARSEFSNSKQERCDVQYAQSRHSPQPCSVFVMEMIFIVHRLCKSPPCMTVRFMAKKQSAHFFPRMRKHCI